MSLHSQSEVLPPPFYDGEKPSDMDGVTFENLRIDSSEEGSDASFPDLTPPPRRPPRRVSPPPSLTSAPLSQGLQGSPPMCPRRASGSVGSARRQRPSTASASSHGRPAPPVVVSSPNAPSRSSKRNSCSAASSSGAVIALLSPNGGSAASSPLPPRPYSSPVGAAALEPMAVLDLDEPLPPLPGTSPSRRATMDSSSSPPPEAVDATPSTSATTLPTASPHAAVPSMDEELTCCICLEPYTTDNPISRGGCMHHFHLPCLLAWKQRSNNCPMCCAETLRGVGEDSGADESAGGSPNSSPSMGPQPNVADDERIAALLQSKYIRRAHRRARAQQRNLLISLSAPDAVHPSGSNNNTVAGGSQARGATSPATRQSLSPQHGSPRAQHAPALGLDASGGGGRQRMARDSARRRRESKEKAGCTLM